jgi:hypothetical protein
MGAVANHRSPSGTAKLLPVAGGAFESLQFLHTFRRNSHVGSAHGGAQQPAKILAS